MKSAFYFIVLQFFIANSALPQTWSDPVNISKSGSNYDPGFTIDNNGAIHCVWVQWFGNYISKIYY